MPQTTLSTPTPSNLVLTLNYLLSAGNILVATRGFLDPVGLATQTGITVTPDNWHFVTIGAARQLAVSVAAAVLLWRGEHRAAGVLTASYAIVKVAEAWAVAKAQGSWRWQGLGHLGFAPVMLGLGWALMV